MNKSSEQVKTLINQINAIGQKQSDLMNQIKDTDLNEEKNYKGFVSLMDINFNKIKSELNLIDFYMKGHKYSLCMYEFMILSVLSEHNGKELVKESLKNPIERIYTKECIVSVKINSKSQHGVKLPLVSHNGFYQVLNSKTMDQIKIELISLKAVKEYLIKHEFKLVDVMINHQNNSSSLRECHFECGNLKEEVC